MASPANFWPLAGMMFAAGLGIPVLATLNGQLGLQINSAVGATFVLFAIGMVLSGLVLTVAGPVSWPRMPFDRPWLMAGAVFTIFYTLSITYAAPRIGVGNAVFFVLLGQLIAAATIDHFGLLGAVKFGMTQRRAVGMAIMALGVYLAKRGG